MYDKKTAMKKLEQLIDKVNCLPIKPQKILCYGYHFQTKGRISEVGLFEEGIHLDPRWQQFAKLFYPQDNPDYEEFVDLLKTARFEEGAKVQAGNRKRIKTLAEKCKEVEFQKKFQKFGVDFELLQHCSWIQFRSMFLYHIAPNPAKVFKKMWLGSTKGFRLMDWQSKVEVPEYLVLLWSPESPSFRLNCQKYLAEEGLERISKKYYLILERANKKITRHPNFYKEGEKKFLSNFPIKLDDSLTYEEVSALIYDLEEYMFEHHLI